MPRGIDDYPLAENIRAAFDRYLDLVALEAEGNLVEFSPVETGRLQQSWFIEVPGQNERIVASTAGYAIAVSEGWERDHRIYPQDAEALRFEVDGNVVYAAWVGPASFEGTGYIDEAIKKTEQRLDFLAEKALDEENV